MTDQAHAHFVHSCSFPFLSLQFNLTVNKNCMGLKPFHVNLVTHSVINHTHTDFIHKIPQTHMTQMKCCRPVEVKRVRNLCGSLWSDEADVSKLLAKGKANLESAFRLSGCFFSVRFPHWESPSVADEWGVRCGKQANKASESPNRIWMTKRVCIGESALAVDALAELLTPLRRLKFTFAFLCQTEWLSRLPHKGLFIYWQCTHTLSLFLPPQPSLALCLALCCFLSLSVSCSLACHEDIHVTLKL